MSAECLRVAILGATSHIAKGVIARWAGRADRDLILYARSPARVSEFLASIGSDRPAVRSVEEFGRAPVDLVVNCIGIGDPGRLKNDVASIFSITEFWDCRVLEYLSAHPDTLCINFSSGAAYGGGFSRPADEQSQAIFPLNALTPADFYGIAKLNSEARHRAAPGLNIVDLRIFSYFSRYIDLSTRFLLTDVAKAMKEGFELSTAPGDIVRDYVHPDDLAAMLDLCIATRRVNAAYDVYSLKPVGKFEMLDAFADRFGLRYRILEMQTVNATGDKDNYFSLNHRAAGFGYHPAHTSLEGLCLEMAALLSDEKDQI